MSNVNFVCRKCEHVLAMNPSTKDADELMYMIFKISNMDCPYCGEQSFENWVLSEVTLGDGETEEEEDNEYEERC